MNTPIAIIVAAAVIATAIILAPIALHQFVLNQCVETLDMTMPGDTNASKLTCISRMTK